MGPPPRSFAADAHGCIMVRVLRPTEYKVVARLIRRAPKKRAPLWSSSRPHRACRRARSRQGMAWQGRSMSKGRCDGQPWQLLRATAWRCCGSGWRNGLSDRTKKRGDERTRHALHCWTAL